ncbi:efflux transporter outer membrane subunit [Salinisphaera japonica]|uniref:RND transporter n=1 Tax=Salinisphaera japonica YTM-1 TaxID=1209778 RepID=A0A423Q164_9GAMM|nr:efflux transporter outer membrane subunit [Salinisphaera japonica]ROO31960.1 RND transporter [Salinisphaera japonica YTM-1]
MSLFRIVLTLGSLTALAGCAVGPDYERPELALDESYSPQIAGSTGPGTSAPVDDAALIRWWNQFDDPALSRYMRLALAQNLNLAQARARVTQARAVVGGATADLLPSANVSGQAARAYQSVETQLGRVLNTIPTYERYNDNYEANLTASWDLDLFGGLRRARQAALADYEASMAGVAATRLGVAAEVADTYMVLRGVQQRLDIAQQKLNTQRELLRLTRKLSDHGLIPEAQTDQQAARVAQTRAALPVLRAARDQATNGLDVLLGVPPGTYRNDFASTHDIPRAPALNAMGSPRDLLTRRPDLMIAERRLMAANARIGAAIAQYYPSISLTGLIGTATTIGGSNLFSDGATQAAGAVGLRWRLFDFGRINAQIKAARGRNAEMLAAYRQTALQATQDVENAVSALTNRQEQSATLASGVASLDRARAARQKAYERGVASQIDVLQVDARLLSARDAEVQARVSAAQAAVATFRALGGGWNYLGSAKDS